MLYLPGGGARLFLAGADHGYCKKAKIDTAIPPGHRRILKKGRPYHTPRILIFQKENGGLKLLFQNRRFRRKAEYNGLVVLTR